MRMLLLIVPDGEYRLGISGTWFEAGVKIVLAAVLPEIDKKCKILEITKLRIHMRRYYYFVVVVILVLES